MCSRPAVFQAMFVVQQPHQLAETGIGSLLGNDAGHEVAMPGRDLTMETMALERKYSPFELALVLMPRPDGSVGGKFEFNTDIFLPETMQVRRSTPVVFCFPGCRCSSVSLVPAEVLHSRGPTESP